MLAWCIILFLLGITAFLDSLFNYGHIFQTINAILFMLVSLGLLVRVMYKMKGRRIEKILEENVQLKRQLDQFQAKKSPEPAQNPK